MIKVNFDDKQFMKDINNLMEYSIGFLEGSKVGKRKLLSNIAQPTIDVMKEFIDANARVNPSILHHVYEWYKTGSPEARLYDITYTVSNLGLSFRSTFRQSNSLKNGSSVPFYDKARIMENGIPVRIRPRESEVLVFEADGEQVFTKKEVLVKNPGGKQTVGSFERVFDTFFKQYFKQSFLKSSGILDKLKKPVLYKKNFAAGKTGGRSTGYLTGYRWIANAGAVA
jgi:hypothetical protein